MTAEFVVFMGLLGLGLLALIAIYGVVRAWAWLIGADLR